MDATVLPGAARGPDPGCVEPASSVSERVLILAPLGQDSAAMDALLRAEGLETIICEEPLEAARQITAGAGALVLTEEALELSQAPALLNVLQGQPPWSELPVIILTSGGESRLGRLLNLSAAAPRGATLLERPIRKAILVRSLQVALSSRRRQYQLRHLMEAQAQLAAIVTSSDDAIVSKTLQGIVTTWNVGAERMFGYTAEEMVGQPILRLIPPELHPEEDRILSLLKSGQRIHSYETIRVTKNGTRIPVSLTISPMRDETGKLIGASKIAHDITQRRAVEERLRVAKEEAEAASRAKDDFLAALSHELRTPLTPVLMTAASLREDPDLSEEVKAQLAMMERYVTLEARLIDDLLDISRISYGKLALRSELCDIHSIIGFVVEIIRHEALEKEIGISLDLKAARERTTGDASRLQQVFWNLLRNAVKFTPPGGHIEIRSYDSSAGGRAPEGICVAVSDNGIGFEPDAIERIFKPFEQGGANSSPHRGGGLGLGLAIARAIVGMHRGAIRAESAGPGKGSTFTVELPAGRPAESQGDARLGTASTPHAEPQQTIEPMRLLLVEDDDQTLKVLSRFLTRDGHEVQGTCNLDQARKAAAANHFDAVISDLGLPDGTGLDLMKELRERYGLRGIMLSGYGMEADLRQSREAGFAVHLVKPVDVNDLRRALRQLSMSSSNGSSKAG